MKTSGVPTASYYSAGDSGWTAIIRLIAILGLIIAAFGLLQWTAPLLKLFPAFAGKAQPVQLNGSWVFVSTIVLSTLALLMASSIACLYRHELGRRGMLICAGLLLFGTALSGAELLMMTLHGSQYLFSKGPLAVDSFMTSRLKSIFADAIFPLFVLTLLRSPQAKQAFRPR